VRSAEIRRAVALLLGDLDLRSCSTLLWQSLVRPHSWLGSSRINGAGLGITPRGCRASCDRTPISLFQPSAQLTPDLQRAGTCTHCGPCRMPTSFAARRPNAGSVDRRAMQSLATWAIAPAASRLTSERGEAVGDLHRPTPTTLARRCFHHHRSSD